MFIFGSVKEAGQQIQMLKKITLYLQIFEI